MNAYTSELNQEINRKASLLNTTIAHGTGIDEQLRNNCTRSTQK